MMRILTVRQPWAWAIIHGDKNVENRSRNIAGDYRGPVAIHVAAKYAEGGLDLPALDVACDEWCAIHGCATHPWFGNVGTIIGVVDLTDVHPPEDCYRRWVAPEGNTHIEHCSPWADPARGIWHLALTNPRPLATPIPYRGGLGLRRLDQDTINQIEEATR